MNNKKALELIIENNQKNKDKYENLVINDDNEFEFERLLKDFVSYFWIKQHPEHFLGYQSFYIKINMKILKPGIKGKYYRFTCPNCNCESVADISKISSWGGGIAGLIDSTKYIVNRLNNQI